MRGPAEQLPFDDGTLDAVVTTSAFHFFDQPAALREFHRVLASGGLVAVASLSAGNRCCRHPRPIGGNLGATHWRPRCGLCRKAQDSRLAITVPATGVDADRVRPDHRRHQKLKSLSDRFAASRFGSLLVAAVSHREQPFEEVAVTPEGETEVFGGSLFATGPLILEP